VTRLVVCADAEAAAHYAAGAIHDRLAAEGERHVALAGGGTPRRAYEILAAEPVEWDGVNWWLGDERCVPSDGPDANALMVRETLGDRGTLHPVRGELCPEDAAWLYASELVAALGDEPVLDVVVLGLGEDGHTASLFPGRDEASAALAPVIGVRGAPKPPPERISMTLPVLARARYTVMLATGAGKRDALARVRGQDAAVPAGSLGDGLDEIVCDSAAAGWLTTASA